MKRDERIAQVKDTVEAVARFEERVRNRQSPFHLSPCGGCGAPCFQQPCSLCGFYPHGADKGTWHPETAHFEDFAKMVEASGPGGEGGTVATWHAREMAGRQAGMAREQAARLGEEAASRAAEVECCGVMEIWETVSRAGDGFSVTRDREPLYVSWGWSGFCEAAAVSGGTYSGMKGDPEAAQAVSRAAAQWTEAVHAADAAAMSEALALGLEACRMAEARLGRSGNLGAAMDFMGKASESLAHAAPGPRP